MTCLKESADSMCKRLIAAHPKGFHKKRRGRKLFDAAAKVIDSAAVAKLPYTRKSSREQSSHKFLKVCEAGLSKVMKPHKKTYAHASLLLLLLLFAGPHAPDARAQGKVTANASAREASPAREAANAPAPRVRAG